MNYNQDGYNPYNDKGMFITQQDIEYQAKVYNVNDDDWWDATKVVISTGLGHAIDALIEEIPGASAVKEIVEACVNITEATADELLEVENKLTYTPRYTTADAQIQNYTYLAKSSVASLGIDETNGDYGVGSYLYFDNNDYVSFDYQLSYTPVENETGYDVPWETRIARGLSLTFNSFIGDAPIQESDNCTLSIFDEDEREYKDLSIEKYANILPGGENLFTFTPKKSGHYSFITNGSSHVLDFEMIDYNFEINKTVVNQFDVKVELYLQKDVEYKFRVSYLENHHFGLFNIDFEFTPQEIYLGDNSIELEHYEYYYKFVPELDAYYKIVLEEDILQLYDDSLNALSVNVDGYSILEGGNSYYILLNKTNYNSNSINLLVMDRVEISFYNNKSDASQVETMYYSTIESEDLYVPSRTGYNFIGWETYDGVLVENINDFIEPNLNLYAKWEVIIYNVNYYGLDSSIIKTDTYTIETGFYLDNSITIKNYIILSWMDENGNVLPDYYNGIGNIECYPDCAKEKSIIAFNLMSEVTDNIEATLSLDIESIELTYEECVVLPMPTISGFEFGGWYEGTTQITDEYGQMFSDVSFKNDTIIVAKWIRTEYHFNIDTINSNGTYIFNLSTRNGIDLSNYIIPVSAVNDNSFPAEVINNKIEELLEDALINNDLTMALYKPGYHFEFCTMVLNDSSTRIHNINLSDAQSGFNLFPFYESNEHIINLFKDKELLQTLSVKYDYLYDKYINNEPCFTPEYSINEIGYIYMGVYRLSGDRIFDEMSALTFNGLEYIKGLVNHDVIDLAIEKKPINYTVTYNSNGGTGTMPISTHIYGALQPLSSNNFVKTGYTFAGWNTSANGTGMNYSDSQYVNNLSYIDNDNIILYAQWKAIEYTVAFNPNGGDGSVYTEKRYYDEDFIIKDCYFTKKGYFFEGWSKTENGEIEYLPGDETKNLSSQNNDFIILYAIWQPMKYDIIYKNLMPNMVVDVNKYTYGKGLSELPTIYICENNRCYEYEYFKGWYSNENLTNEVLSISKIQTGNVTLYAKYDFFVTKIMDSSTKTVTDGNINNQPSISVNVMLDSLFYEDVKNTTLNTIKITISFDMWEVEDGYQHIYLYNGSTQIWSETIDRGTGRDKTVKNYTYEIELQLDEYKDSDYLDLKFHASGFLGDEWKFNNFEMEVFFTS